jgi:DNA-binding response OmpR family regulator
MARDIRPALVLLDIRLPGMDGFEARRRLRADPVARDIPVVAVSANAMPADVAPARAAGVAGHVTKPLGLQQLLAVVDRVPGADGAGAEVPHRRVPEQAEELGRAQSGSVCPRTSAYSGTLRRGCSTPKHQL